MKHIEDIHTTAARKIFVLTRDEQVTREQRYYAKCYNFMLNYGVTEEIAKCHAQEAMEKEEPCPE